jgi:hypothetical protein
VSPTLYLCGQRIECRDELPEGVLKTYWREARQLVEAQHRMKPARVHARLERILIGLLAPAMLPSGAATLHGLLTTDRDRALRELPKAAQELASTYETKVTA